MHTFVIIYSYKSYSTTKMASLKKDGYTQGKIKVDKSDIPLNIPCVVTIMSCLTDLFWFTSVVGWNYMNLQA